MFGGVPIIFNPFILKDSEERLFPVSKHRSKRIHKKLVKRFGGEFKKVPAIWMIDGRLYAHPSFKKELEATKCVSMTGPSLPSAFPAPIAQPRWNLSGIHSKRPLVDLRTCS